MVLSKKMSERGKLQNTITPYEGRHRFGAYLIPLGDKNRVRNEINELEERDSDPNIRRI